MDMITVKLDVILGEKDFLARFVSVFREWINLLESPTAVLFLLFKAVECFDVLHLFYFISPNG